MDPNLRSWESFLRGSMRFAWLKAGRLCSFDGELGVVVSPKRICCETIKKNLGNQANPPLLQDQQGSTVAAHRSLGDSRGGL